jgi:hypothetical protein
MIPAMTLAEDRDLASTSWPLEFESVRRGLARDFPLVPSAVIDRSLAAEVRRFEGSRNTAFVPILVDKNVRAWLRDLDRPA